MTIQNSKEIQVNIVGSSIFGRYPKISTERTYNMFISDEWLLNFAGFQKIFKFVEGSAKREGRGLFHSTKGNFLVAVVASSVFRISDSLSLEFIGNIETVTGEVVMDENLSRQILIVDGQFAYVYSYEDGSLTQQDLTFLGNPISPTYVSYHNTFFLITPNPSDENSQNWYALEKDSTIPGDNTKVKIATQLQIETKPDSAIAIHRIPGKGNNIVVLGTSVGEIWTQVGGTENYRRVSSYNIDSGAVSRHTVAASTDYVCWLGKNEKNSPSIMYTNGGETKIISTDGIDFLLQSLKRPDKSTAMFYKQDGHLFYIITFFDPCDNLSLFYDFKVDKFYHLTDDKLNFHPARQIAYFNEKTYFISLEDASLFEMSTDFVYYNYNPDASVIGEEIPRKRITNTIRSPNNTRFRVGYFSFWLEQGVNDFFIINAGGEVFCEGNLVTESIGDDIITESGDMILDEEGFCIENARRPRVDLSFSKNGNQSFSNRVDRFLNGEGVYRNQINWYNLGQCNEITIQIEFWGLQRFVASKGFMEIF